MNNRKRKQLMGETCYSTPVGSMQSLWGLVSAYWKSDQKKTAWKLTGAIAGLTVLDAAMTALGGYAMKPLIDTFTQKAAFDIEVAGYGLFLLSAALAVNPWIASKRHYMGQKLQIAGRGWLTNRFNETYRHNNTFHHLKNKPGPIQNADQALSEAPREFMGHAIGLGMGSFSSLVKGSIFTGVLVSLCDKTPVQVMDYTVNMPGQTFWMIYGAALGLAYVQTKLFQKFGAPLHDLNEEKNHREAALRAGYLGVKKDSGLIAPYGVQGYDRQDMDQKFDNVQNNSSDLARAIYNYNLFSLSFAQTSHFIYLMAGGAVSYVSKSMTWGTAVQLTQAFTETQNAWAWWGNVVPDVAKLKATGKLLTDMAQQAELAQSPRDFYAQEGCPADIEVTAEARDSIHIENLTIQHPATGAVMFKIPDLTINQGERILINGKSGSGKSSLMAAMAGLFYNGSGRVHMPAGKKILYAAPYMLSGATLRENIAFPEEASAYTDEMYISVLKNAELTELMPYLDCKERNNKGWESLSDGEKQRLLFSRVFLQKPDIVFLDEATSGMDEGLEQRISYKIITALPQMTIVSTAHRDLEPYHTKRIQIYEEGTLEITDLPNDFNMPYSPYVPCVNAFPQP